MSGIENRSAAALRKQIGDLMKVALGEMEADMAIVNGSLVNVYTGEVLPGQSVLIKGEKIAYVGKNAAKSIGAATKVIDAGGKFLIPGFIDGHAHNDTVFSTSELVRFAMKGGTTTIISETSALGSIAGYRGITDFLAAVRGQPIKIFLTAAPVVTISPVTESHAITAHDIRRLYRRKEVLGLGELCWGDVINGNQRLLDLIAGTIRAGKKLEGHTSGASNNKLQAYLTTGISSCHEPTTAAETLERLRLGLFIMLREGEIRKELEEVSRIKDEKIDFSHLGLAPDGVSPSLLINEGYMESLVQKAIDLGFDPVLAIQMATINVARHFGLDDFIGGIGPGKVADIVMLSDIRRIKAEYVISNGRIIARNGELLVSPRKHLFPNALDYGIKLDREMTADDFAIRVDSSHGQVKVRVIDQITGLVTKEAVLDMPAAEGRLKSDPDRNILKVAAIERVYTPGKIFCGLIRGMGFKRGAIATSYVWDCSDIMVAGAGDSDMAQAVNRLREIGGGIVVCAGGRILAEMPLPFYGVFSSEPMEVLARQIDEVQQAAAGLGCVCPDIRLTMAVLATPAIPFLRICEHGLVNLKENRSVDFIAE